MTEGLIIALIALAALAARLGLRIAELKADLAEARKNDHRDPKTGRFAKRKSR